MTLIVGIKAQTGVVVASDSAATYGGCGTYTVQETTTKLSVHDGSLIIGTSGPVGLGQRLRLEAQQSWDDKILRNLSSVEAMVALRNRFHKHIVPEMDIAKKAIDSGVRQDIALEEAYSVSLVAVCARRQPCLFRFGMLGAPEEATEELSFASVGSGLVAADPFLSFLKRIFWPNNLPTLEDAIFAAVWTLDYAIKAKLFGIGGRIQVATLESDGRNAVARELSDADLQEHFQAIVDAEDRLRQPRSGVPIPEPQAPPTAPS